MRSTSVVECFNRYLLLLCPKIFDYVVSHEARVLCGIARWNETKKVKVFENWIQKLQTKYGLI